MLMIYKSKTGIQGVTLVELLIAVALFSVLCGIALIQSQDFIFALSKFDAKSQIVSDFRLAQSQARMKNCRTVMSIATDGTSYQFGCDFTPYNTDSPTVADSILFSRSMPNKIFISSSTQVIFNPRGEPIDVYGISTNPVITISAEDSEGEISSFATGTVYHTGLYFLTNS